MRAGVQIKSVAKSFGNVKAVEDVSATINEGEIFGFIGPDGAGKTTLFRMIVTLLIPDAGKITVNGADSMKDMKYIRSITGYMPGRFSLYHDLSVEENLRFYASIFGTTVDDNYETIKMIYGQLESYRKRPAGKLSGGMKQKLALSCALVHKPEILVLDEPTTGVDAISRREFWQILSVLKKKGITIIVSTPYMDEANLCDRVALMQEGQIMEINSPSEITGKFAKRIYSIRSGDLYKTLLFLRKADFTYSAFPFGQDIHFISNDTGKDAEWIMQELNARGIDDARVEEIEPQVEDCFIDLMLKKNE
ncbi:MAG: ABC transporter ATP-binding protein [Bacteroidota bacterium]